MINNQNHSSMEQCHGEAVVEKAEHKNGVNPFGQTKQT
jgi:hypothetical protein